MTFKETSVHIHRSFEYQSPDGEEYLIAYSETPDRKYVEIKRKEDPEGKNKVVHDYELLCGIVDGIRDAVRSKVKPPARNLAKPVVSDMRTSSGQIQSSVDQTMKHYNDNDSARESLTVSAADRELKTTPEEWSLSNQEEAEEGHTPQWKKDAKSRSRVKASVIKRDENSGEGFRRVDANELI